VGFLRSVVADARPRGSLQHSPSVSSPERKHGIFSQAADSTLLSGETGFGGAAKPQSLSIDVGAGFSQINRFGDASLMDSLPPAQSQCAEHPVRSENPGSAGTMAGAQPVSEHSLTMLLPGQQHEMVATPSDRAGNPPMQSRTNRISAPLTSTDDGGDTATVASEFVALQEPVFDPLKSTLLVEQVSSEALPDVMKADAMKRLHAADGVNAQFEQSQGASELSDLDYTDESSPIEGKAPSGGLQPGTVAENRRDVKKADYIYPNEVRHQSSVKKPVSQELARQTRRESVMLDSRLSGQRPVEQGQNSTLDKTTGTEACSADAEKKINDMNRKAYFVLKCADVLQADHAESAASVPPRPVHQGSTVSDAVKSATIRKPAKPSLAGQGQQIFEQSLGRAVNHAISRQSSKKSSEPFAGPKVQIGQVDVTIEVQQPRSESSSSQPSSLASIASHHYLRGL